MKQLLTLFSFITIILFSNHLLSQTCNDGIQNGTETGIDCGGTCPPCSTPCSIELTYTIGTIPPPPTEYIMSSGTVNTCSGTFYDPGGPTGNYGNNNLNTQTFCSDSPGDQITFTFTSWASENNYDYLRIYDNSAASGTVLFYGSGTSPGTVTSTSGCLTFVWDTDGSVTYAGWAATISCGPQLPPTLDCGGGDIVLTAVGQGASVLAIDNDFDAGDAGTGWTSNISASFANPCDPSIDGGTYMWMGNSAAHPRIIQTIPLDLSCGGEICFWLDFATQGVASPCEGIDLANEGVYFDYSINGGANWTTIEYFGPAGVGNSTNGGGTNPQMVNWNQYCYTIPAAAETPNTIIRWAQTGSSGLNNDHWGIDNVTISSVADCTPYWYDYDHIVGFPDNPVLNETVSETTTFYVTYTNGNDACSTSIVVNVGPCPCPDATVSGGGTYCTGDSIPDVVFSVTGGAYPLTLVYAIDGVQQAPIDFSSSSYTLYNPTSGQYTIVSITDTSNCIGTFGGTADVISNTPPVLVSFTGGDTYCAGETVGNMIVEATGNGPFTINYTLDGVAQTPVSGASPLNLGNAAGIYVLTSLADQGCTLGVSQTDTIIINPIPSATAGTSTPVVCVGETVSLTGNTATGVYSWTGPDNFTSSAEDPTILNATTAASGTYTLIITNNGCVSPPSTVNVTINSLPVFVDFTGGDTYCNGETVENLMVGASGTNPLTISYTLNGIAQTPISGSSPLNLGNSAGVYVLTALADQGCSIPLSQTQTIVINPIPVATAGTTTPVICAGDDILLTGNTETGTYSWTGPNSFSSANEDPTILNATVSASGTYTLVITSNGCVSPPSTVDITVNAVPIVTANPDQTICIGTPVTLNGQGATTYTWDNAVINGVEFVPGATMTYTVTGTSNGCTATATVVVTVLPYPIADAMPNVSSGYNPLNVNFQNLSSNANSYIWDFGNGNVLPTNTNGNVSNTYLTAGTYYVLLTASNGICSDTWTDSIIVITFPAVEIHVPNVFSPNGDDANDLYFIDVINGLSFEATIINRWGNVVHTMDELNEGWDGKINGNLANDGVYFIKYIVVGLDGSTTEGHTYFHLVR